MGSGFIKLVAVAVPLKIALTFWFRSKISYALNDESFVIRMPFYELVLPYKDIDSISVLKNSYDNFRLVRTLKMFRLGAGEVVCLEKQTGRFRFVYIKPETADNIVLKVTEYNRGRGIAISDVVNGKRQTRHLHFTGAAA